MKIAVLGATGKTGRYLVSRLCDDGQDVVAIGRDPVRLDALDSRAQRRTADLERPETMRSALVGVSCVVSLAHARYAETVLETAPQNCEWLVLTGSTRKFTRLPDPAADAVRRAEKKFLESGRPGVMLHPSMIYGAPDDRNVNRILRYLRRWPRAFPAPVPLPDGGRNFVQPVFVDDVIDAFVAAATSRTLNSRTLVLAGPEPMTYAEMIRSCARALDRRVVVLAVPTWFLATVANIGHALGVRTTVTVNEFRRAAEDKTFDLSESHAQLGFSPRPFADGLRLKIERGWT